MFWLVVEAAFVRGLAVAARRLAYQRALAKRQAAKEAGEGNDVVIEEPTLDIEQVNQQSLRLIRLALLAGFIAVLYWVWADLISVFSYLDNITLYEYTSGTGANMSMVPISIGDMLGALIIIGITFALARNPLLAAEGLLVLDETWPSYMQGQWSMKQVVHVGGSHLNWSAWPGVSWMQSGTEARRLA